MRAHGIDISKYDLYFLPETALSPLDFVIQRVGYSLARDEAFETLWEGTRQVEVRGGYHYLSSAQAWKRQADLFLKHVEGRPFHFFACDFEEAYNLTNAAFAFAAWQWIQYVREQTGKRVVLYTSLNLYDQWIVPSGRTYGLDWDSVDYWQAQWLHPPDPNKNPSMPKGRKGGWKFWQYTEKGNGTFYGVARPGACDLNVFNGSVNDLHEWLKMEPKPKPPQTTSGTLTLNGRTYDVIERTR